MDHQDEGDRDTAAHAASRAGFSLTLELLCKERANLYMKNRGGFTALHLSCQVCGRLPVYVDLNLLKFVSWYIFDSP